MPPEHGGYRPRLVIFVKEPHPGKVKTRLARGIGAIPAVWWFRHQSARLLRRLAADPRWQTWLAVSPDREGMQSRVWPRHIPRWPQGPGTVGDRMARCFRAMPPGPLLVIGADIPGITAQIIADAFAVLGRNDAIFGPASDGGFWLVGLKRTNARPPGLFKGVRWSEEHALADSLVSLGSARIGYAATLDDVDVAADLARLKKLRP